MNPQPSVPSSAPGASPQGMPLPTSTEQMETERDQLQQMVADADTGGRHLQGLAYGVTTCLAVIWALGQLYYASPLPFILNFGIIDDTRARSLHLAIALFLAFLTYPAFKGRSDRHRIPVTDWILAAAGAFCAAYLYLFYEELAQRSGEPTPLDIGTAIVGMILLLEATRRTVGWPMAALALVALGYVFAGPIMPEVLAHKGATLSRAMSQMWLGTEGVFGIALGVSVSTIFIYVLFGSLLDTAGGGNYMMQVSYALLGHLRGGPAKVAVISSALNGVVSGSSVANVVSGGIFTIPLMKRAGYGGIKAGAIETMSSVNGQIMPPVMGAAAFLMTEYVGLSYADIVRHAILPAVLSYIGLFYIVHLEALKLGLKTAVANADQRPLSLRIKTMALGTTGSIVLCALIYYAVLGLRATFGESAGLPITLFVLALYVLASWQAARSDDLPVDIDINNPVRPLLWPTLRAGLHFMLPVGVLIWLLMVDEASPALAAFWACAMLLIIMLTQHIIIGLFRRQPQAITRGLKLGLRDTLNGLVSGSRSMVGIAIATATAGIIVGTITLTGLGFRMTDMVELVSGGNVMAMLIFTAVVCLILGLGVPTTANYILVASLMAPVIVELGAQHGLIIPLVAVHLFVFYYGIMGDITPPVGLATFAASAISGESPIRTGIQGTAYALRTVILPFIWIFNPMLLLIGVDSWWHAGLVFIASTFAMLAFAAVSLNWMRIRLKWWESGLLLVAIFILFRPDYLMDQIYPRYRQLPAAQWQHVVETLPAGSDFVVTLEGETLEGDSVSKTLSLPLGNPAPALKRLSDAGLGIMALGDQVQVSLVRFGSPAKKIGFEQGWNIARISVPTDRPNPAWFYLPGLLLQALVWFGQGARMKREKISP